MFIMKQEIICKQNKDGGCALWESGMGLSTGPLCILIDLLHTPVYFLWNHYYKMQMFIIQSDIKTKSWKSLLKNIWNKNTFTHKKKSKLFCILWIRWKNSRWAIKSTIFFLARNLLKTLLPSKKKRTIHFEHMCLNRKHCKYLAPFQNKTV